MSDPTTPAPTSDPVLAADDLTVTFPVGRRQLTAVDSVSLSVSRGETLALVGESGSGKTTTALAMIRAIPVDSGTVVFDGADITNHTERQLKAVRRRLQIVLQDPYASLDPRMTVGKIVAEPLKAHRLGTRQEIADTVAATLEQVGLPADAASRYPGQFSGGQRQRISIARALVLRPSVIVADEPVSALDVSIQAQIIGLLADLQAAENLAYLVIAHDLALVHHIADRVAVMYLGRIVEEGPVDAVVGDPQHPYTAALLSATPTTSADRRERIVLGGEPPSPISKPTGCAFHPRCPAAVERCRVENPALTNTDAGSHRVACFFPGSVASGLTIGTSGGRP
ncbi:MAG: ATP-binding cassette domain-containing protein [Ilumatobacter fluminis]|uniref:Glutathione import ATP-binding protein GsiA n=1 Tax=Ilumatobacter fluminis TaxID=467091 RepID=A0A4R7I3U2_9ACTN|nr:oligopeptide/dipeptide ABC transporter ATP-binding protein [Ilumatobacter fluminis]TDT18322.1 peptide/nickel transport system ATP-binding protein [Ilumatobacter fluminis]